MVDSERRLKIAKTYVQHVSLKITSKENAQLYKYFEDTLVANLNGSKENLIYSYPSSKSPHHPQLQIQKHRG